MIVLFVLLPWCFFNKVLEDGQKKKFLAWLEIILFRFSICMPEGFNCWLFHQAAQIKDSKKVMLI